MSDFVNLGKDGREYVDHAIVSPLCLDGDLITHYVAIQEDVTKKNAASKRFTACRISMH